MTVPMVGRLAEFERLREELRRSAEGELRVVLIVGDAGVGKSRLMAEILSAAGARTACLTARSYRLGATDSFGPWIEALDRYGRAGGGAVLDRSGADRRGPIGREEILESITTTLDTLSRAGPVVIAFDDMDLSDASSWEGLRFVGRRLWNRPVTIIATARDGRLSANSLATDVLLAIEDDGQLQRIALLPLPATDVAELTTLRLRQLERNPPEPLDPLVRWVAERSLGHPLFIIGLVDALVAEGGDLSMPTLVRVPEQLMERVRMERAMLGAADLEILEVLSVMDRGATPGEVAEAAGLDGHDLDGPLARLCTARLVTEIGRGPGLRFDIAHPLIRDCIYDSIPGTRRLAFHRRIARGLLARGNWGRAVAHFARAASDPDSEALGALCLAIKQTEARGLYRESLEILRVLLDVLPHRDARWRDVFDAISSHDSWLIDHLAEQDAEIAIAAIERIEEACRDSASLVEQGSMALYLAALLSIGVGRLEAAEAAAVRAVELFDKAGDHSSALRARNELVWIASCAGGLETAVEQAGSILTEIRPDTAPAVEVQAAGARAYALGLMGRPEVAHADFRRAEERASKTGNRYRVIWGLVQQSHVQSLGGTLQDALRNIERAFALDYTEACDALALERLAHCRWLRGELTECVRAIEESGARRQTRGSRRRAWGLALAARAHAESGDLARAQRYLAQAADTYGDSPMLDWSAWCPWGAGFVRAVEGDYAGALRLYRAAHERFAGMGARSPEALVLFDMVEAALRGDDVDAARAWAKRLEVAAADVEGELPALLCRLARAMCAADSSSAVAAEAVGGRLEQLGYRLLALTAAEFEAQGRERLGLPGMVEALERAARSADACGATWRRDRMLSLLARAGSRGRRIATAILGPGALTERERQVAALAARGHSAEQIGKRLFIGTRTVETHLAHIYPKLGIASKQELISRARELGIAEPHQ